jgi:hypothetical protein
VDIPAEELGLVLDIDVRVRVDAQVLRVRCIGLRASTVIFVDIEYVVFIPGRGRSI